MPVQRCIFIQPSVLAGSIIHLPVPVCCNISNPPEVTSFNLYPAMANNSVQATPPAKSKAQILSEVFSLAAQFSACVEAFNLIHPSKDNDHAQKVALAKLGLQQGRLLIFGDAVGISAPPATIARHMIPSHPGLTNPDPHLPVNFGVRDPRLDEEGVNAKIHKALNEIAGRPGNLSRELMEKYGLKSPKHFSRIEYPALDTNRLEGFREKYALLQDLVRQTGARGNLKRNMSMTTSHWTVKNCDRFNQFVKTVRIEVDALIELLGVKEQVDRGTRSDIRCMAWHPDLTGPIVQHDWEKLRLIREACEVDYPEYVGVVDTALQYINEELKETSLAKRRASYNLTTPAGGAAGARRKSDYDIRTAPPEVQTQAKPQPKPQPKTHLQLSAEHALDPNPGREKRPSWLSAFKLKSWSKSHRDDRPRSMSVPDNTAVDPQRSLSEGEAGAPQQLSEEDDNALEPVRSKSLSAIPDAPALDLDSRMKNVSVQEKHDIGTIQEDEQLTSAPVQRISLDKNALVQTKTVSSEGSADGNGLYGATTYNSLIDRHDMYQGIGRIETKDIRGKAHEV
ncbi:prion-inhibition and propagation-domain-containing protein [Phaeosphaeriaceae sp. PMI808]|nr:prion-inhibition and propagation-domain-containing protein [Phaeosphaeriaceae sp. PMI808]